MFTDDISIIDTNGLPVFLCEKSPIKLPSDYFKLPYLSIDNFQKYKKEVEIKRMYDLKQIEQLGYRLMVFTTTSKIRNYPGQKKSYALVSSEETIPMSIQSNSIPPDHYIEYDVINKLIRIRGKNSYPYHRSENAGDWRGVVHNDKSSRS